MKYVRMRNLKSGDVVGQTIYGNGNQVLLRSGSVLNDNVINKLNEMGFSGLYVESELTADIEIEELITPQLRNKSINDLKNLNVLSTIDNAKEMVASILAKTGISLDFIDSRDRDNYIFQHSVSVAQSSVIIGKALGYNEKALTELATSALLHDVGKLCVKKEVMKKVRLSITQETTDYVEQMHPYYGYSLLSDLYDITAPVKVGVLYHHINEDGTGYPKFDKLPDKIYPFAKIIHVADAYDEKIHEESLENPGEAVEYLMGGCGTLFNQEIVEAFLKFVPVYPLGTTVQLNGGTVAVVCGQNKGLPLRPQVLIAAGPYKGRRLNLASGETLNLTIVKADISDLPYEAEEKVR